MRTPSTITQVVEQLFAPTITWFTHFRIIISVLWLKRIHSVMFVMSLLCLSTDRAMTLVAIHPIMLEKTLYQFRQIAKSNLNPNISFKHIYIQSNWLKNQDSETPEDILKWHSHNLVLVLNFESFFCALLASVSLVNKNGCKVQH